MTSKKVYLLGIGHNTPVCIDLAEACGYTILGLYHYNNDLTGQVYYGYKVIGCIEDLLKSTDLLDHNFLLTMGDNKIRASVYCKIKSLRGNIPTLIHPSSVVSRHAHISEGVHVGPFTNIQADSSIGENSVILSGVNISHSNKIGKNCFVAGGATIGAHTVVGDNVFIGQGALTISKKVDRIGDNVIVGARALVTKSIDDTAIVAGSPARVIGENKI